MAPCTCTALASRAALGTASKSGGPGRVPLMVVAVDVPEELKNLKSTMSSIEAVVDLDALRGEIKRLNEEAAAPDLWDDQAKAQKVTSRLSYVQGELNRVES